MRASCYGPPVHPRDRVAAMLCALLTGCSGQVGAPPPTSMVSASPSPAPSASLAVAPTLSPLPTAQPVQTLAAEPGTLALEAISCDGGVVLQWSPSADPGFHHYTALRSPARDIPPQYPPIAPAVDWGGTFATDRFVVSAVDASIRASDTSWSYRVMSYDVDNQVLESSAVVSARVLAPADLGPVSLEAAAGGARVEWTEYGGPAECFSEYRILHGDAGLPSTLLATVSAQGATSARVNESTRDVGVLQVEAIRTTALGSFVVARSEVLTLAP